MVRATCSACAWSVGGRALARRPRVGTSEGVCSPLGCARVCAQALVGVLCAWNACGQLARMWPIGAILVFSTKAERPSSY